MPTSIEELRARAAAQLAANKNTAPAVSGVIAPTIAAPNQQANVLAPALNSTPMPTAAPAPVIIAPIVQAAVPSPVVIAGANGMRTFHHPVAGSTSILPSGEVLTFVGHISGEGDRRRVGEGFIETNDAQQIAWLSSQAQSRFTQISEVILSSVSGQVEVVLTKKKPDPTVNKYATEVASRSFDAMTVEEKQIANAISSGSKTDIAAGAVLQPDTSVQTAMAAAEAAGDLTKPGTVHNAGNQ